MLPLDAYRQLLKLDEPWLRRPALAADEIAPLTLRLLDELRRHDRRSLALPAGLSPRQTLRAELTCRQPEPLPSRFLDDLELLLTTERAARPLVVAAQLPTVSSWSGREDLFARRCALYRGDIVNLAVDAVVNAANSDLLGCFQPFHACIDNRIHDCAGPRLRADCGRLREAMGGLESTGNAKLTRGYELPARFVLHTVGPICEGRPATVDEETAAALVACYRACLDTAAGLPAIRSLAFCCISTGVFGFPERPAAKLAISTVAAWLESHPQRFDLVVFNLFRQSDDALYRQLCQGVDHEQSTV